MCIIGDFNVLIGAHEAFSDWEVRDFTEFISNGNLLDLVYSGSEITWCNNRDGPNRVLKRLDRGTRNGLICFQTPMLST